MKKTLLLLLVIFTFAPANAQDFNDGTYNYNITTGTDCEVIGWVTLPVAPITVNIPPTVLSGGTTYNVVQVANGAFSAHGSKGTYRNVANTHITSITLPSSVVTIADHAFRNNPNLLSVNLENVVTIGAAICNTNPGLIGEFNLTSCTTLGNYAFFGCNAITKLNTPALTTIGTGNFYGMKGLLEFDIPDSVTMIGNLFSGVSASGDAGNFSVTQFQLNWDATELAAMTANSPNLPTNFFRFITDKSGITMYIPEDAIGETTILDAYTAHPQFGLFTNIVQGAKPTLSANNLEQELDFSIYPNPANNVVSISSKELDNANVTVYDLNGRVLLSNTLNGTLSEINISSLVPGVYLFKVEIENSQFVKRIVKQ